MKRRAVVAGLMAVFALMCAFAPASFAEELQTGAARQVKPNAIWFEDAAKLKEWQDLGKSGDAAALKVFEDEALAARDAWQFTNELAVKVLSHDPATNQINVEMTTPGRLQGSRWFLDAGAMK